MLISQKQACKHNMEKYITALISNKLYSKIKDIINSWKKIPYTDPNLCTFSEQTYVYITPDRRKY